MKSFGFNPKKFLRPSNHLICLKTLVDLEKGFLCVSQCGIRTEPEIEINICFIALLLCKFSLLTYSRELKKPRQRR